MNVRFWLCLVIACFTSMAPLLAAAQGASSSSAADASADKEIRRLNTEEVEAFLHKDSKAMEHLWSDDMVVTNPLNKFVTRKDVLGMMQSGFLIITSYDRRIEYLRIYHGDTAIVAGSETVTWGGKMPNAGNAENLRFTAVWMRQRGRWQEVARHANVVPQQ